MSDPQPVSDRQYNNADSFAHAFDQAWQQHNLSAGNHCLERDEKLAKILEQVSDHPFAQSDPAMARQVAEFRIRLLGL
ncbi:MAG: hypothetical protein VKJ05_09820 [Synechococcaceae cyanobacterium]|nr:hypothetical protein [Synechococcaceae cyanobacterium]